MQRNFLWIFSGPEDTVWAKKVPEGCSEVGMKIARKRTELGATIFVFIYFCRSGNEYRNPGNEYGNRYYRKQTQSEYKADMETKLFVDRNLKVP